MNEVADSFVYSFVRRFFINNVGKVVSNYMYYYREFSTYADVGRSYNSLC